MVDELCRFKTVSVCITSRITTIPQHCKRLVVPTLSAEAACDTFYSIYNDGGRSDVIDDLLQRLDYHALSVTLLATTASHNMWDYDELSQEWDTHRAQVLRTDHDDGLAATIELSLTSPTFQKLGPDARKLLAIVAFFPQGVDKKNLDWLFPTIPDRKKIFDKFCVLSLTHRVDGFTTMLAPIRDYLCPRDPRLYPLLSTTKDRYFARLSITLNPGEPSFGETKWIRSEDVNVEQLLDVFTPIDMDAGDVLDACAHFMEHLYWHKPRQTVLGPRIEALPNDQPSKAKCLFWLSHLFNSVGNYAEEKRILSQALTLVREQGNDDNVAQTLQRLSNANRMLEFFGEGIQQEMEALKVYERLGYTAEQAECWSNLALFLLDGKRLDAAEEAVTRAIDLFPETGEEFRLCQCHTIIGKIYHSKGEREKAIHHFEEALETASTFNWHGELFWIHYAMAELFCDEGAFDDAHVRAEQARPHAGEDKYRLGRLTELRAHIWFRQRKLKEARSEVLRAKGIYEKLGLATNVQECRYLLQEIDLTEQAERPAAPPG